MSIEGIERFNLRNEGFEIPVSDGEWMRYSDHERIVKELEALAGLSESPILAFQAWCLRWIEDNGRKLTQEEYGIAYSAFIAAHPGQGPLAHTMSVPFRISPPSLSDAIREVEQMRDEKGASLGDEDLVTHLAAEGDIRLLDEVVARLRSLGTQTQDWK